MICRSIVFVIAFSFLIVDIKTADTENENEEMLEGLSLFGNEESDDDEEFWEEENDPEQENMAEEPHINAPIQTSEELEDILGSLFTPGMENHIASKNELQQFFDNEHELLQNVESFLYSEDSEDYSKLNDDVAYGLVHVANLTFWISTNFRICTLLYSQNSIYSDDQLLTDVCNNIFDEMMSFFNYLKEKIEFFVETATAHGQTYGNDIQVESIAKEVLTLSSDFVRDEDYLYIVGDPDQYVDGMIKWSSIDDVMIDGKAFKTIFPSFKKLFCNCGNVGRYSSFYEYVNCRLYYDNTMNDFCPLHLVDTDGDLIPEYRYQNFFGYHYPQFNVCNCGTFKEGSSSSSRNDDIGVCNCEILNEFSSSFSTNDDTEVCNCGALKEGSSSSFRNDDIGVYDDTNVASSSSNRPDDISSYNEKVQIRNKGIAENIRIMNRTINKTEGDSINFPTIIDMYNFLEDLVHSKKDYYRFNLVHDYSTIKIGKGRNLHKTVFTTWLYGSFKRDIEPMWKSVKKFKLQLFHNNNSVKNVFRLIYHIRRLDQKVALWFAVD